MTSKLLLAGFGCALFVCASALFAQTQESQQPTEPKRPYTISKETTYFTGPLKPDGSIDFIAAVNEHFAKGITAENNAARIITPLIPLNRWDSIEQRDKVLIAIGLDPKDHTGARALNTTITKEPEGFDKECYNDAWQTARDRLWKDDEFPLLTQWLSENEAALGAISAAAKRERYYVPLTGDHETGLVMTAPLDDAQAMRFVAAALVVRANNHMAQRRWGAAWADILTIQELSRLMGQGQSSIQSIISTALSDLAAEAAKRFINAADETIDWAALIDSWQTDASTNFRDQADIFERAMFIQVVCQIWDEPERSLMGGNSNQSETEKLIGKLGVNTLREMMESKAIDMDGVFCFANSFFDQAVTVFETEEYSQRWKLAKTLEDNTYFYKDLNEFYWPRNLQSWTKDSTIPFAKFQLWNMFPAVYVELNIQCRNEATRHVVELGLAARLMQAITSRLPTELHDLDPYVDPETLIQPFRGEPVGFRQTDNGVLLYHGHRNLGKDDGGDIDGENPKDWGIRIAK